MKKKIIVKTNYLPAIVTLLAGFIYCLMGLRDQVELTDFMVQLLIVLLVFYILGGIIKIALDVCMEKLATPEPEETDETSETEGGEENEDGEIVEKENIHTEETETV